MISSRDDGFRGYYDVSWLSLLWLLLFGVNAWAYDGKLAFVGVIVSLRGICGTQPEIPCVL
jgi:hypothetical protein